MNHARKFAIVPYEDLNNMGNTTLPNTENSTPSLEFSTPNPPAEIPSNIIKDKLYSLDSKMKSILDNSLLSPEDKVTLYNDALEDFLLFSQKSKHVDSTVMPPFTSSVSGVNPLEEDGNPDPLNFIRETLLSTLPKTLRKRGEIIFNYFHQAPDVSLSPKGELIIKGQAIKDSNIIELIHHKIRKRRKSVPEPSGYEEFLTSLKSSNIPENILKSVGKLPSSPRSITKPRASKHLSKITRWDDY